MKRQLLSGLLALVLVMTGCSGAGSPAGTKEAEAAQETTQEAEEVAAQEATQGVRRKRIRPLQKEQRRSRPRRESAASPHPSLSRLSRRMGTL